jgi:hypothetical protein
MITTATDFELIETESYAVERIRNHMEMDCSGGGEYECPSCDADSAIIAEVRAEMKRREAEGISIADDRVGLHTLEPFGLEWEREQSERYDF